MNGQDTIDRVKLIVNEAIASKGNEVSLLQPIDLLLLDFQMPHKNGLQVVNEVK